MLEWHIVGVVGTVSGAQDQRGCVHTAVKAPWQLWVGIFSPYHTLELPREWQEDPGFRSQHYGTTCWVAYFEKHSSVDLPKHIMWNLGQVSQIWFQFTVLSISLGWHQSIMYMETNFMHPKLPNPSNRWSSTQTAPVGEPEYYCCFIHSGSTRPCLLKMWMNLTNASLMKPNQLLHKAEFNSCCKLKNR